MSDEFDGPEIDNTKWQTEPVGNGWQWLGRAPGLFRAENVRAEDGKMKVTVGVLAEPVTHAGKEYKYQGAIIRSISPGGPGMYFETRMKANATGMSTTFWLITKPGKGMRQELDIQECVGDTSNLTQKWGREWDQIFHSNLIRTETGAPGKVQIQDFINTPTKNHERFYVYAAWWKSSSEVQFFLNGEYVYSLRPDVAWEMPAYLQMAIETYDWNPLPEGGGLVATGTQEQRTTQYDWIRVWRLE
ncbi:glycosyl hydrolase [Botrimarina hoheduenensis]|nr:glycosyl hydrolase [Botrimarina hoheduenensis]